MSRTNIDRLCRWAAVAKSSLYYHVRPGLSEMKPGTHTMVDSCGLVENSLVVEQMRAVLLMDYCVYG